METKEPNLYKLHEEHKKWLSSLTFYKDELAIMQKRIAEIAEKNSSKDILANVEHFQNQFVVQREQIDVLSHNIRTHEEALEKEVNKNETAIDHRKFPDHTAENERMENFEKIFNDLRRELNLFLKKWM